MGRECPHMFRLHITSRKQPVTLAHHVGAYLEMFVRQKQTCRYPKRMNTCPLGAALAGTTPPLSDAREYTAQLLGFDGPTRNSMDLYQIETGVAH